jgi:calcineurin-like phosphoesterase family protein
MGTTMKASELITHVRRILGSTRRFLWTAGVLGGLCALVALGSCGKSPNTAGPEVNTSGSMSVSRAGDNPADFVAPQRDEDGSAAEIAEDEAAEDAPENDIINDREFNAAAARGEFATEYRAGETAASTTAGQTVVLVGAGDIANSGSGKAKTAALIASIPGTVFTAGDNAYSSGSAAQYNGLYNPTWGKFRDRTFPAPGNHEYRSSGAKPYFSYFGAKAGPSGRGYYSYNIGDWHILSLNSNISMAAGSAQEKWVKADLAANPTACALAYWHHPRFSSGSHGSSTKSKAIWQDLYNAGAEIVVVGHDHDYERFAPMTAAGVADAARGIREFVVGSGGTGHRSMGKIANSEARNANTFGVMKFTLAPGSYQWEFIPASGSYHDSGSGTCHN